MPKANFLVPAVTDSEGNLRPKYSEAAGVERFNALLIGSATTEEMVPHIAARKGVTEQQVRDALPTGQLYIVRVTAPQNVLDSASGMSDVEELSNQEVASALNLRYNKNYTVSEWADIIKDKIDEGNLRTWTAPSRNFDGIRHSQVRQRVDVSAQALHDAVSDAYYAGTNFIWNGQNHGVLIKPEFEMIHGYAGTHAPVLAFHEANLALDSQGVLTKIPESEYRFVDEYDGDGNVIGTIDRVTEAQNAKQELVDEGLDVDITISHPDYGQITV